MKKKSGPLRDLNPGPPAPKAGIIPLDQEAWWPFCIKKGRSATVRLQEHGVIRSESCLRSIRVSINPKDFIPDDNLFILEDVHSMTMLLMRTWV